MNRATVIHQVREGKLALASKELFEKGALDAGPLDMGYVRRLNTVMARRRSDMEKNIPATLADAINKQEDLKKHAELVVFGNWLVDGSPGVKPRPGPQAAPKKILKCVAAIIAEIKLAALKKKHSRKEQGRESRKREITKHALADQWKQLFDEEIKPANFDAPLRSAKHILSAYREYLKSGSAIHAGQKIRKSPEIEQALAAINGLLPVSQTDRPDIFTEPDPPSPAKLMPFEISLEYQSDAHAEDHRWLPSKTKLEPRLRYVTKKTSATSPSGSIRADRKGTVTLVPDVEIRRDYKVEALIDRVVILAQITKPANAIALNHRIKTKSGAKCYIKDIFHNRDLGTGWGAPLSELDPRNLAGYPLAIMIQEPTPVNLAKIIKIIDAAHGVVGTVHLHLIEVSIDFHPKKPPTPEEAVLRRERMVGLLQRHHWTRPGRFQESASSNPRHADARQVHDHEDSLPKRKPKVRYLFAHVSSPEKTTKHTSDSMITNDSIRNRVLTTNKGYPLWLNSTVSKGDNSKSHLVSIQNKITDRRNPNKSTYVSLPDDERRARMEVTISGTETLQNYDLHTIDDLSRVSFRKLARNFLRCRLPVIKPTQHNFEDAKIQMRNRGVYGVNLRLRALVEESRLAMKQAGGGTPRKTNDEEMGLADWKEMNDVIGVALDGLKQRWSKFTTR